MPKHKTITVLWILAMGIAAVGAIPRHQPHLPDLRSSFSGDGNRVKKTVVVSGGPTTVTKYLVDDRNPTGYAQVLEERDGADTTLVTYVYGLDLISQKRGSVQRYFGYDGLGTTRYLTTTAGAVDETFTYDAFGILTATTGTAPGDCAYRYTGEQWDPDLGMYYLRARYLNPAIGRFWTMDSFEGSQSDPLSLHKYLYCHGDGVNFIDPGGHTETLVSINVSTLINSYLSGAFANVGANAVVHAVLGQRYSGREIAWDALTGGFLARIFHTFSVGELTALFWVGGNVRWDGVFKFRRGPRQQHPWPLEKNLFSSLF